MPGEPINESESTAASSQPAVPPPPAPGSVVPPPPVAGPTSVPPSPAVTPPPPAPDNVAPTLPLPPENVVRGLLLALLAIPAGIFVYMLIWNLGFIASIVGLGVAFAAFFLYRLGSGGRVSVVGAVIISAITIVTLLLAWIFGEVWDYTAYIMSQTGMSAGDVLGTPGFAQYAIEDLSAPGVIGPVLGDGALTLGLGLLGCVGVIVNVFRTAKAQAAPVPPVVPPTP